MNTKSLKLIDQKMVDLGLTEAVRFELMSVIRECWFRDTIDSFEKGVGEMAAATMTKMVARSCRFKDCGNCPRLYNDCDGA